MYVGVLKLTLVLSDSHSLKDKRMVLRRMKDRVRERLGVALHEVGHCDSWQRSDVGCAVVSGERVKAASVLDQVVRVVAGASGAEVVEIAQDVSTFDHPPVSYSLVDERTGAGDKAQAQGDPDWIPTEWLDEVAK